MLFKIKNFQLICAKDMWSTTSQATSASGLSKCFLNTSWSFKWLCLGLSPYDPLPLLFYSSLVFMILVANLVRQSIALY